MAAGKAAVKHLTMIAAASVFFLAFWAAAPLVNATDARTDESNPPSYVKLEVRGKLLLKDGIYCVEGGDPFFHNSKVTVQLRRSEDKNRMLDQYLKSLEGEVVTVRGFMDCRSLEGEKKVIRLYLSQEAQVEKANGHKGPPVDNGIPRSPNERRIEKNASQLIESKVSFANQPNADSNSERKEPCEIR